MSLVDSSLIPSTRAARVSNSSFTLKEVAALRNFSSVSRMASTIDSTRPRYFSLQSAQEMGFTTHV